MSTTLTDHALRLCAVCRPVTDVHSHGFARLSSLSGFSRHQLVTDTVQRPLKASLSADLAGLGRVDETWLSLVPQGADPGEGPDPLSVDAPRDDEIMLMYCSQAGERDRRVAGGRCG